MKHTFIMMAVLAMVACTAPPKEETTEPEKEESKIALPYKASYESNTSQDVKDEDLLTVLNTYKGWEEGDMALLRSGFGDSLSVTSWTGEQRSGLTDDMIKNWAAFRDSLQSVELDIAVWTKNHSVEHGTDFIVLWYKEVDTYKDGRIDSADWHDINQVKDGKIIWYSQYKRPYK